MRIAGVTAIALTLFFTSSCSRSGNGPKSSNASSKNSGAASNPANGGAKGAAVPDPHASNQPNAGRQAGVGDDPSNLEAADPKENGGDSGKPGPAQKP